MAIRGAHPTLDRIGVVLMAPDIDVELVRSQAEAIGPLPQPFVIFASQRDPALALSARQTGQPSRLGNSKDIRPVAGLDVTVSALTDAQDAETLHQAALSSPSVMKVMQKAAAVRRTLDTDQSGRTVLVPGTALIAQKAAAVILAPISAIEEAATR